MKEGWVAQGRCADDRAGLLPMEGAGEGGGCGSRVPGLGQGEPRLSSGAAQDPKDTVAGPLWPSVVASALGC